MRRFTQLLCLAVFASCLIFTSDSKVDAGYPVYYAPPAVPAVVGYTARRGGLFGQRTIVRPVVAPVAVAPVVVARPVVRAYYAPPAAYVAPVVTTYRVGYPTYVEVYGF